MKTSFITTVFNEENTIKKFLESLLQQKVLPNEIIIVDGMSTDNTVHRIKDFESKIQRKKIIFKVLVKKGNRSVGRNEAIKHATGDIILCSDAGNILDNAWIKNITKPFTNSSVDVVAGYYKGKARNIFQKCLIPYALVMPDQVDPENFLPATRSIAFKKSIWKKVGRFDEKLSHNEDYVFAQKLVAKKAKIVFAKDAIVYWLPRSTYKQAFTMFFRFAFGDGEAGIVRSTVLLLFARYIVAFYMLFLIALYRSYIGFFILAVCFVFYLIWSIKKNYRYVMRRRAFMILPLLQLTADIAVLSGTTLGLFQTLRHSRILAYIQKNKLLIFVLISYVVIMLSTLQWGIPNQNHPFPYHMDEWHQFHAVGTTFTKGTPNTVGSANGTMFHFIESGFYLAPFILAHIIDPLHVTIDNSVMRERIFEILRLNTLLYGVFSIIALYYLARLSKASEKLTIILFTFCPIWLSLSGYFKYDIALIFWIILSLLFFLRFANQPNNRNYLLAAIPASLAVAVKVSAMPLFIAYIVSFFWFHPSAKKNIKYFFLGIGVFVSTLLFFGAPDTLFGKGNISTYFFENVLSAGNNTSNLQLGMDQYSYLLFREYPLIFGHGLVLLFLLALTTSLYTYMRHKFTNLQKKQGIYMFFIFVLFVISLYPLGLLAGGNRSLVLLPFFALIIGVSYRNISDKINKKVLLVILLGIFIGLQIFESFAWYYMKLVKSPQEVSSVWIQKNIPKGQIIGVENIPIYQALPDIIEKEFYYNQYHIQQKNLYTYVVVSSESKKLPSVIVITSGDFETNAFKNSPKKNLIARIQKEGYEQIAVFYPDFTYYKYLGNEVDYTLAGMIVAPVTTVIYKKY